MLRGLHESSIEPRAASSSDPKRTARHSMTGEDPRDFLTMLLAEGVISTDEAKVLHHEVGFCDRDRARISALVTILKHRHPDVSDKQIEIEATALHLAHLAVTAVGGQR